MDSIDLHHNYCLSCRDEYRAEITCCAVCGATLVSGAELLARTEDRLQAAEQCAISAEDTLLAIQTGSLLDMKKVKKLLEDASIPALLTKEESCRSGCGGPQIMVHVRQQDGARASEVLRADHIRTTGIESHSSEIAEAVFDPKALQAVCPACGHEFMPEGRDCPDCGLCFL